MSREKYSCYEFEVKVIDTGEYKGKWEYVIYDCILSIYGENPNIESDEWFDTEQEARFAAVGHIDLLENGSEPDYDKEPATIDWDERRKLGE